MKRYFDLVFSSHHWLVCFSTLSVGECSNNLKMARKDFSTRFKFPTFQRYVLLALQPSSTTTTTAEGGGDDDRLSSF